MSNSPNKQLTSHCIDLSFNSKLYFDVINGTIINAQLLMVMKKFNFFKNFKKLLMGGGHNEKLKFSQIEKIIGDFYKLDNLKQKIFF